MKNRFSPLLLVAAVLIGALLLSACEKVVEVEPPPHDPQLVPVGFFTPNGGWVVRVSRSVAFTDTTRPGFVDSATVEVWSAGRRVARLPQTGPGTYAAASREAAPGTPYTLHVAAPGFPATEGHDALPPPPQVVAFRDSLVRGGENLPGRRRTLHVRLTVDDPPGETFYGLQIYQMRLLEDRQAGTARPLNPTLFPFESNDPALGESTLDLIDTDNTAYQEAFFPDDPFAGERRTLRFALQYDAARPDTDRRIRRAFVVLLISASEDFYRYWTSASEQLVTGENPFAEPLRVHSNMSGGLGIFAGFQYRLLPLGLDTLGLGGLDARRFCEAAQATGARLPVVCEALPSSPPGDAAP